MISIVTPCYNDADVLPRAINSLLAQTYEDYEIIIVDDGSTPPIENIWTEYNQVRVIKHPYNLGLASALNTGVRESIGDRFIICSSDDALAPNCLEKLSVYDAEIVSCDFIANDIHVRGVKDDLETLKHSNCHGYAALVKKSTWERVGGFKEAFNHDSWEDYEFWLNCAKHKASCIHISLPLHIYNRNPNGRDVKVQGKDIFLRAKLEGFHQDLFGNGKGVVSFIIPCFRQEKFLAEAVQSALNQTYPHIQVIVVDDESPGNVKSALTNTDMSRVIVHRNSLNKGLSGSRNIGIEIARSLKSEYIVMLDADDKVESSFIEETMQQLDGTNTYIYTDVRMFGDAWHIHKCEDYSCQEIISHHLHACTFLMPSTLIDAIQSMRGYNYDENMKLGYEDWEWAIAAIEAGWCGKRLAKPLFLYRNHLTGSMRTRASSRNNQLKTYIHNKHSWINNAEEVTMACSTCGGSKNVSYVSTNGGYQVSVLVPYLGEVPANELLTVKYLGTRTDTMRKTGRSGKNYAYSAVYNGVAGPEFQILAQDANLFPASQFHITRTAVQQAPVLASTPSAYTEVVASVPEIMTPPIQEPTETILVPQSSNTVEYDDLTTIKYIGPAKAVRLNQAGMYFFRDVANATKNELMAVLTVNESVAAEIIKSAATLS